MPMNVMLENQQRNREWRTLKSNGDGLAEVAPAEEVGNGVVVVDVDGLSGEELEVIRRDYQEADCLLGKTCSTEPERLQQLIKQGFDGIIPAGAGTREIDCALAMARHHTERCRGLNQRVAELERKLEDRILIERAKGIIASRAQIGEEEALRRLRREARNQRRSMREIAERLLEAERMLKVDL